MRTIDLVIEDNHTRFYEHLKTPSAQTNVKPTP